MSKTKRERGDGVREDVVSPKKKAKLSDISTSKPHKSKPTDSKAKKSAIAKDIPSRSFPDEKSAPKKKSSKVIEETATDSDPIVESDTQSESGNDDGVSWPSDQEQDDGAAVYEEDDMDEEEEDGGVQLATRTKASKQDGTDTVATASGMSTSRESHMKQKALVQERKAAKPHADAFARSKKIWERLRLQSHVPLPERKKLVGELFEIITGRVKDFVLKHDASRVIQTALKYGNLEQRKMIAREIKGSYCELAQSKFAKHAIGKILVHGDDEIRDIVIPEFFGNVRKLIKHPEAAWILDDVYRGAATTQQKARLLREWYSAEFAIFTPDPNAKTTSDLAEILKQSPEKKTTILRYLFELINQLIQKKTTGFTMLHDAMLQYYINVRGTDTATEFLEVVKGDEEGDLLKNLAFTQSGARLVCLFMAYSSAKDRKQLLKAYKGVVPSMAFDKNAHKVLMVALDVIDDTRLTSKSIYGELLPLPSDTDEAVAAAHTSIAEAALHLYARTAILYPFVNKLSSVIPKETQEIVAECQKIRTETSKKEPKIRCAELAKAIAPQVLAALPTQMSILLAESFGCQLLAEVLLASSADVVSASTRLPTLEALVAAIRDPEMTETLKTPHAGRMLKSLVLSGHFSPSSKKVELVDPPLGFADVLFTAITDDILTWATGANSFVIVGMSETEDLSTENKKALGKILTGGKKMLKTAKDGATGGEKGNKGAEILFGKIEKGQL